MELSKASTRTLIQKKLKDHQNLLAVSKFQSIEKIEKLFQEGQRHFAENYIQEALEKINNLKNLDIQWHLIGPIQKNKVKFLQKNFKYIHSVDSLELAQKIASKAAEINHVQKVFIQINLTDEPNKSGFKKKDFLKAWPELKALDHLEIVGLMTMPPLENDGEKNRIYFKQLKILANELQLKELSMGTSQDYEAALEEGATWVRLGTVLFGERR
ncbi:MAG: YggS family pyridoxal phosphate-dependent enzyme [Bdellovibrionaceae bacterium]|nr:YggS family pyridoxal phosphate-dependent enzyme [Bdellovibrio sp.]